MFKDKLNDLMSENAIDSQRLLSKLTGIPPTTISGWFNAGRLPDYSAIQKLATFFDVSADYLLGLDDFDARPSAPMSAELTHYSADERKLIENYRELNASGKNLVQETAKTLRATVGGSDKKETRA